MLPVACQDSRAQVRHLPEPLGPAWMLPGWKEEKREGGKERASTTRGCPASIEDVIHLESAVPACQQAE